MYRCSLENTREQIVPESLYLHILAADQSKIYKHICSYEQLRDSSGMFVFSGEQKNAKKDWNTDIWEI